MEKEDLSGLQVVDNGKIINGMVRVLVSGRTWNGEWWLGSLIYSDELLFYSYPIFRARIDTESYLIVENQGRIIHNVNPKSMFWVQYNFPVDVVEDGWLIMSLRNNPRKYAAELVEPGIQIHKQILKAQKGESHPYDNSPFFRVDPALEGNTLFLVRGGEDETFRVIDQQTRRSIPASRPWPIAYPEGSYPSEEWHWDRRSF